MTALTQFTALPETLPALRAKRRNLERVADRYEDRFGFRDEGMDDEILAVMARINELNEQDELETYGEVA